MHVKAHGLLCESIKVAHGNDMRHQDDLWTRDVDVVWSRAGLAGEFGAEWND